MELTIYRGTHEVGGTAIEMKTNGARILLDAGYPLFLNGELIDDKLVLKSYRELLELGVIPDIKGLYSWDEPGFDAVVISHAHSDHYGLLKYIHPKIPIYCSETTKTLIGMSLTFPDPDFKKRKWCTFSARKETTDSIQNFFAIEDITLKPYPMDHSAFEASAFEINAEGKTILYTGDFRGHGRQKEKLDRFIEEAPKEADLLLIEGTTLGRTGESGLTEEELEKAAEELIGQSSEIVLVQPSSQNIERIISFYQAAKACGKVFVMDIYTADLFCQLNKLGYHLPVPRLWNPELRVFYPLLLSQRIQKTFGKKFLRHFRLNSITKSQIVKKQKSIVMIVRPSMLFDMKLMNLKQGTLIYSLWQAYRSKPYQVRFENYLKQKGFRNCYLHTSGHAFEPDIRRVIDGLEPKKIIPIHTFCPEVFLGFSDKVELKQDGVPIIL